MEFDPNAKVPTLVVAEILEFDPNVWVLT
jgi:hypothetical protein